MTEITSGDTLSTSRNARFSTLIVFNIALGAVVAYLPNLSHILLLIVVVAVVLKLLAISAGIAWISRRGPDAFKEIRNPSDRANRSRQLIYDTFDKSDVWFAPFGVNDWRWRKLIDDDLSSPVRHRRIRGWFLRTLRVCYFRFESQAIVTAIILTLIPYTGDNEISTVPEGLACVLGCVALVNSFLMGLEILIGNALLKNEYHLYFHFGFDRSPFPSGGSQLLREIGHFIRLILFSLIVVAATCFTYFACRGSFCGILTSPPSNSGYLELENRLRLFCEFVAFAMTTLSTVGYGDVHPTGIISRLLVAVIQFLTFSFILFLLQVLLTFHAQNGGGNSNTTRDPEQ